MAETEIAITTTQIVLNIQTPGATTLDIIASGPPGPDAETGIAFFAGGLIRDAELLCRFRVVGTMNFSELTSVATLGTPSTTDPWVITLLVDGDPHGTITFDPDNLNALGQSIGVLDIDFTSLTDVFLDFVAPSPSDDTAADLTVNMVR